MIDKHEDIVNKNIKTQFQSEDKFQKLIESAPDIFFAHDLEGNIIHSNRYACKKLDIQSMK